MQTGNLCNLACKMCQPKLSIQVGKFYKQHFDHPKEVKFSKSRGFPTMVNNDSFDLVYDWPVQNKLSDVFDEYIKNGTIKRMYLTGGEPTIITENLEFLKLDGHDEVSFIYLKTLHNEPTMCLISTKNNKNLYIYFQTEDGKIKIFKFIKS